MSTFARAHACLACTFASNIKRAQTQHRVASSRSSSTAQMSDTILVISCVVNRISSSASCKIEEEEGGQSVKTVELEDQNARKEEKEGAGSMRKKSWSGRGGGRWRERKQARAVDVAW